MIKTLLKLLIALAILNAVARSAMVAWQYYELRDEALQLVTFGARVSTAELQDQILAAAADLDVPLEPGNVAVRREGLRTFADASYTRQVELFPRYFYPVDLAFSVDAVAMGQLAPSGASPR